MKDYLKLFLIILVASHMVATNAMAANDNVRINLQVGDVAVAAPSGGGGAAEESLIVNVVDTGSALNQISISWRSNIEVSITTRWGEDARIDGGVSALGEYRKSGNITINNLASGTKYWVDIEFRTKKGQSAVRSLVIQTKEAIEDQGTKEPATAFRAIPEGRDVKLSWKSRSKEGEVRIVKSDTFFARDPYDGIVVYEGENTGHVIDRNVKNGLVFYTLFQKYDGKYSTGVGAVVRIHSGQIEVEEFTQDPVFNFTETSNQKPRQSDGIEISFCQSLKNECKISPVITLEQNQEYLVNTKVKTDIKPDILTMAIYSTKLDKSVDIFLLEKDLDFDWKLKLPRLLPGEYSFTIQAYRGGQLLSQEVGAIAVDSEDSYVAFYDNADSSVVELLTIGYLAILNIALLALVYYLIHVVVINKKAV